ncbi:MAG: hypothetical protein IVW54_22290 [Candidatus Binataceae bacterium]|nr:hypothetical protein [Candidatus Binataceae bacterium]
MGWIVRDLLLERYGYSMPVEVAESDVAVGVAAVQLVAANPRRVKLYLDNFGAAVVAIGFEPIVTATTGRILASGGELTLDWMRDFDLVTRAIWAISAASGNSVHVTQSTITGADDPVA